MAAERSAEIVIGVGRDELVAIVANAQAGPAD